MDGSGDEGASHGGEGVFKVDGPHTRRAPFLRSSSIHTSLGVAERRRSSGLLHLTSPLHLLDEDLGAIQEESPALSRRARIGESRVGKGVSRAGKSRS